MRNEDISERVRAMVTPSLEQGGVELVDVELAGNVLRVTIDRPEGVDLELISDASRRISTELDVHDDDLVPDRYVLEVSSPGIERPLRRPEHFKRAVGSTVAVKTHPGTAGDRRVDGVLESADDEGVVVGGRAIPYPAIERARTRFVWPEPRQTKNAPNRTKKKAGSARTPGGAGTASQSPGSGPPRRGGGRPGPAPVRRDPAADREEGIG